MNGDIPMPGDYFNEGYDRMAVFRPSNGYWYVKGPGTNSWGATAGNRYWQEGMNGDVPLLIKY